MADGVVAKVRSETIMARRLDPLVGTELHPQPQALKCFAGRGRDEHARSRNQSKREYPKRGSKMEILGMKLFISHSSQDDAHVRDLRAAMADRIL